jgi:hypothetical protein
MGSLLSKLLGAQLPPDVVLSPPLFLPNGVTGLRDCAKSGYSLALSNPPALKRLLHDHVAQPSTAAVRLLLSPPDSELLVSARVASTRAGVSLLWQPPASEPGSFAELKLGRCVQLRGAALHAPSGLALFGSADARGDACAGLRLSRSHLGLGLAVLGGPSLSARPSSLPLLGWAVFRAGCLTAGLERRPCGPASCSLESQSRCLSLMAAHGISAAVSYRSQQPGKADSFTAGAEITADGRLIVSVYQHLAVCRRVHNPFEMANVRGISNYIDLGLRLSSPLVATSQPGGSDFDLAGSWQVNKNVLAKLVLGSASGVGAHLALKSWWQPSATLSLSALLPPGASRVRYGLTFGLANVGVPRFEQGGWEAQEGAASRRHVASAAQMAAARGEAPLGWRPEAGRRGFSQHRL